MKKIIIFFTVFLAAAMFAHLAAQEMPLVYEDENTCADCPLPYLPTFNELPSIQALPDPFMWSDGRGRIENFSDWSYRRVEIGAEIEKYEIGEKPVRPDSISASYIDDTLRVYITVNGETLTLVSAITLPEGDGPFPAVIGMGSSTGSLSADIFSSRDIARIPFNFGQVMAWEQSRGNEPINKLYPDLIYMGAYSAWSWGVSRLIDGLELVSDDLNIDLKHLAVTGCSFAGKMALFAGAFDERIALTIPQESGGGGAAAWRVSETLGIVETLGRTSHVWFIEDLFQFSDDVPKLPYDHHELMAMVAPRALFIIGNPSQVWLAEESGYVSSQAAQKVWDALEVPDRFGFSFVTDHPHCVLPESQYPEVGAFVDKFLLGDTTANTDIATTPYTTSLSPWIKWSTPTLSNDTTFFGRASLTYPLHLQEGLDSTVTFRWNKVEDAEMYFFQLSTDPTFKNATVIDSTTDTVKTTDGLLKGKRYYWRIQARNSNGSLGPWSEQWNFITSIPIPSVTYLVSAILIPNRSDYITLNWNKVADADKYRINVSRVPTFATLAIPSTTTSDTVKTLSGVFEGQKFYWRVQAENLAGTGPWSEAAHFTIIMAPTDLELSAGTNEITLSWEDNSYVEDGYIIERKQKLETSFTVLDSIPGSGSEYIDEIPEVQNYTYRVKAYKDSAESEYSNEATIILTGIKEANKIPSKYSISQNYPNPFNPSTKIEIALPQASATKIIIYDLLGRKIRTLINKELEAGYHKVNFDASTLPSGIYLYRVQSGVFIDTKKMILMK